MFMLKKTHEAELAKAKGRYENDQLITERALTAERAITASLNRDIYDLQVKQGELHRQLDAAKKQVENLDRLVGQMQPLYDLGVSRKASNRKYNQKKLEARRAAKAPK